MADSGEKHEILKPQTLLKDRFVIESLISTSHVSRMYKGKDLERNIDVAIKELLVEGFLNLAERKQAVEQFQFEADLLLKLTHDNLPKFEDYFSYNDRKYLVMEYIYGDKLSEVVKKSQDFLNEHQVVRWGLEICDIFDYLHTRKPSPIIFRGLCPDNVILTPDKKLKLIDFGISKIFDPQAKTLAVAKTAKMYYSPMEQYTTQTDERTDIYSLGATLYFLITKTHPIDAIDRTINDLPLSLCRKFNSKISPEFENIIIKAMELSPNRRYENIPSIRSALEALKTEPEKIIEKAETVKPAQNIMEIKKSVIDEQKEQEPSDNCSLLERILNFLIDLLESFRKRVKKGN
jgi:serine/threonine-protein kinase